MPRVRTRNAFRQPPSVRSSMRVLIAYMGDLVAYSNRQKRVYAAYTVVMLCRFGRLFSWAFFPSFRFFPAWTDRVDGAMSLEMKAKISLRPNAQIPMLVADQIRAMLFARKSFGINRGA